MYNKLKEELEEVEKELSKVEREHIIKNDFTGAGWVKIITFDKKVATLLGIPKKRLGEYMIYMTYSNGSLVWLEDRIKKLISEMNSQKRFHNSLYVSTMLD